LASVSYPTLVRPSGGRVLCFPHDLDAFLEAGRPIVPNDDLRRMLAPPAWARAYCGHLLEIIATSYNGTCLEHWADQSERPEPADRVRIQEPAARSQGSWFPVERWLGLSGLLLMPKPVR